MPYVTTFGLAFVSGFLPIVNAEACLLSVCIVSPESSALAVVLAGTFGQMIAKALLYSAGRGLVRLPLRRREDRIQGAVARLTRKGRGAAVVFVSALTGLPPFYVVSIAAGILRLTPGVFLLFGSGGRFLRFAAVVFLSRYVEGLVP